MGLAQRAPEDREVLAVDADAPAARPSRNRLRRRRCRASGRRARLRGPGGGRGRRLPGTNRRRGGTRCARGPSACPWRGAPRSPVGARPPGLGLAPLELREPRCPQVSGYVRHGAKATRARTTVVPAGLRRRRPGGRRGPGRASVRRHTRGRPPTGSPLAMRVTRTPEGLRARERYIAVASPSRFGLVHTMTSAMWSRSTRRAAHGRGAARRRSPRAGSARRRARGNDRGTSCSSRRRSRRGDPRRRR